MIPAIRFVKLTSKGGLPIYVNIAHICSFNAAGEGTYIRLIADEVKVTETPVQVLAEVMRAQA